MGKGMKQMYTRVYRKEGEKVKPTLYFLKTELKKLRKMMNLDPFTKKSLATQIEEIVRERLKKVKL